ncbi:hypothetical protein FGO68_gene14379 [Halteria grandinella]|uniref:Uncharacterized protein n=1 Tax=Halteria grandinella TaxID=5974 RepID=A0A8J8NSJ2_HALGN|nr:hypothetical protein FGO68_gene14379 [Halteria grandinella]
MSMRCRRSDQLEIKEVEQMIPLDYRDLKMTDNMEPDSIHDLVKLRFEQMMSEGIKRFRVIASTPIQKQVLKQAVSLIKEKFQDLAKDKPQITLRLMKNDLALLKLQSYMEI